MPKKAKSTGLHVVIVGAKNVGKYSLREQYIKGWIAPKDFQAPTGKQSKTEVIDNKKVEIKATCCGDIETVDEQILNQCDGIIIVYNISDKSSFTNIKSCIFPSLSEKLGKPNSNPQAADSRKISQGAGSNTDGDGVELPSTQVSDVRLRIPTALAGNKSDEAKLTRAVSIEEGMKLCEELSCVCFYETSATCNENISKLFQNLAEEIIKLNNESAKPGNGGKAKKSNCVIA